MAEMLVVTCDAPGCSATLERHDGHPLFREIEDALEAAEDRDWLVWRDHRGNRRFYCRPHWRWHFGMKHPYWGRRNRDDNGALDEGGF